MDPFTPIVRAIYTSLLAPPEVKLRVPSFFQGIPKWVVFAAMLFSYFIVMSGIVYDIINEPPSVGSVRDEKGRYRPQAVMEYRINGQYMIEGFTAGFFFTLGGLGIIILNMSAEEGLSPRNRYIFLGAGVLSIVVSYNVIMTFLRMKVPGIYH